MRCMGGSIYVRCIGYCDGTKYLLVGWIECFLITAFGCMPIATIIQIKMLRQSFLQFCWNRFNRVHDH